MRTEIAAVDLPVHLRAVVSHLKVTKAKKQLSEENEKDVIKQKRDISHGVTGVDVGHIQR